MTKKCKIFFKQSVDLYKTSKWIIAVLCQLLFLSIISKYIAYSFVIIVL